jgi:hypothetical protein
MIYGLGNGDDPDFGITIDCIAEKTNLDGWPFGMN